MGEVPQVLLKYMASHRQFHTTATRMPRVKDLQRKQSGKQNHVMCELIFDDNLLGNWQVLRLEIKIEVQGKNRCRSAFFLLVLSCPKGWRLSCGPWHLKKSEDQEH